MAERGSSHVLEGAERSPFVAGRDGFPESDERSNLRDFSQSFGTSDQEDPQECLVHSVARYMLNPLSEECLMLQRATDVALMGVVSLFYTLTAFFLKRRRVV